MRVSIAGAGNVGRFIARELLGNGHDVLLIDRDPEAIKQSSVPGAEWLLADACELESIAEAHLETCDVAIAATGDDKANLVHTLLAKTEFGVPRTVGRVNHPGNEWLFDELWGVDVAVSTPRIMCALAEEAVTVGDLVRLFSFTKAQTSLVEMTLPPSSPRIGQTIGEITWPTGAILVALIRGGRGLAPSPDESVEPADELLFLVEPDTEKELAQFLSPGGGVRTGQAIPEVGGPRTPLPTKDRQSSAGTEIDYVL
jgi:trk system potassium uptake protein TrkA